MKHTTKLLVIMLVVVVVALTGLAGIFWFFDIGSQPAGTVTTSTGEKVQVVQTVSSTKCDSDKTVDLSLALQNSKNTSFQQYLIGTVDIYQEDAYKKQLTSVNGSGTLVYNSTGAQSGWCDSDLTLRVNTGNTVNSIIDYVIVSEPKVNTYEITEGGRALKLHAGRPGISVVLGVLEHSDRIDVRMKDLDNDNYIYLNGSSVDQIYTATEWVNIVDGQNITGWTTTANNTAKAVANNDALSYQIQVRTNRSYSSASDGYWIFAMDLGVDVQNTWATPESVTVDGVEIARGWKTFSTEDEKLRYQAYEAVFVIDDKNLQLDRATAPQGRKIDISLTSKGTNPTAYIQHRISSAGQYQGAGATGTKAKVSAAKDDTSQSVTVSEWIITRAIS